MQQSLQAYLSMKTVSTSMCICFFQMKCVVFCCACSDICWVMSYCRQHPTLEVIILTCICFLDLINCTIAQAGDNQAWPNLESFLKCRFLSKKLNKQPRILEGGRCVRIWAVHFARLHDGSYMGRYCRPLLHPPKLLSPLLCSWCVDMYELVFKDKSAGFGSFNLGLLVS